MRLPRLDPRALTVDERVRVQWLGTAAFAITCDDTTVLIDPYVTRASIGRCVTSALASDPTAVARYAPRADAVVVGHTHFDHALDVPLIAARTGATVFGSRSAVALCRAHGISEAQLRMVEREPGSDAVEADVGPFHLRFLPSAHSRFLLGRVPFPGEITDCDQVPLRAEGYRCGAVFALELTVAGRRIVHLGSAQLVDEYAPAREPDLLLLCVAGWTASHELPERLGLTVDPKAVLLSHWDNFFSPMERGASMLPALQTERLVDRLSRARRDLTVGTVDLLGHVFV